MLLWYLFLSLSYLLICERTFHVNCTFCVDLFFFTLLQSEDKTVLFAVGSTLVNCTNSYDVEKPDPQMVELAKYAKQHVPEDHPKVTSLKFSPTLRKRLFLFFLTSFACLIFQCNRMHLPMWRRD